MTPFSDSNHRIEKNKKRQKASWLFNITTLLALIKSDPKARFFFYYWKCLFLFFTKEV